MGADKHLYVQVQVQVQVLVCMRVCTARGAEGCAREAEDTQKEREECWGVAAG